MTMLCRTEPTRNGSYWRQLAAAVLVWVSVLGLTGCAAGGGGDGGGDGDDAAGGGLVGQASASTPSGAVGEGAGDATVGEVVTLVASASGGTPPYYYDWWIEDGPEDPEITDPESARASVTFAEAGTYAIGLITTDDAGAEVSQFLDVEVNEAPEPPDDEEPPLKGPLALSEVRFWGYEIQALTDAGAVDALAESHYDMLVLEPTRTDWSSDAREFDTPGMVERLKSTPGSDGEHRKLVIAYIDIGEAEDWRWHWTWSQEEDPSPEDPLPADRPEYIITRDPDGWTGNCPVAYWDYGWQDIIIGGENQDSEPYGDYTSVIDEVLLSGFDGIYLDWVEAFENAEVAAIAAEEDLDPAGEMIVFIQRMREYAEERNPDFIIIQQNAASLIDGHPELLDVIDAIAQEGVWFDGPAIDDWDDLLEDYWVNEDDVVEEYVGHLDQYLAGGLPVFNCEYALEENADEAYERSLAKGYVPYVTRRSLGQLTTTPPPGYGEE